MSHARHIGRLAIRTAGRVSVALLAAALLAFGPVASVAAAGPTPAPVAPITVPFDHFATGFELDGVHRDLPCESCHLNAVFKGTPRQCGTCHITGSVYNATPKVQNHIQSTNNCAACHDTLSFRPYVHFDHANVLGTCASCHNGTIAQGEGPTHPATSQACEACHTVMSWNPPKTVDHTQIPLAVAGYCIICHNGKAASGKPASHIPTTLECGDCHLTTNWLAATFNHTGIVNNCYSCHNGSRAVGKQGSHMPTTNTCEACHTTGLGTATPSWVPSLFDHTQMTVSTCASCHGGTTKITTGFVSGMPVNHVPPIPAKLDCAVCHGNTPAAETWTVLAASIATLHTGLNVSNCVLCHGGESFAGVPAPYIPMSVSGISPTKSTPLSPPHIPLLAGTDCSSCHGAAYTAGGFGPATPMTAATHAFVSTTCDACHDTGRKFYTGSGTPLQTRPADHIASGDANMVSGDCSLCHTTANWNSNTLPAGHMPNPSNLGCATCHSAAPSDYTPATLAANSVLHTGISGNCGLCHGNTTTALTWANNFTPKDAILAPAHIPYLAGSDCSACHTSTTYAAGSFGPMNMTQATHAFAPSTCNTCHETGLSFTMGAASPGLQGRPADHTDGQMAAPNDCGICHTTANWNSSFLPTGHMPNPGNQTCAACHTAIGNSAASYATLASIAVLHTGISGNCGLCHGTPSGQLTFYNNNDNPKAAVLTPAHIPYLSGTDCSNCHTTNYVAGGFGPMNMTPAKHAFVPTSCDSCHEAGLTFYLGTTTTPLQGRPQDHIAAGGAFATGDCSGCHTPTDWTASVLPPGHMPNPGNQACATCHTAISTTFASYATLASIPVLHTGISGNCGQCHGSPVSGQLSFYNNNDNPKAAVLSPVHIPYNSATDCSACHTTNYASGGFGPMNMTAATHNYVAATCDTCHEANLSFYMGTASPALQGRPADHTAAGGAEASGDCAGCHTPASWTAATVLPTGHMPNPANQPCATCHTAIAGTFASYATLGSIAALHTGISVATGCAQCHGSPTSGQLSFYNNNDNPKAAVLTPAHIPYNNGADCGSCHTANYASGGFGPMNMNATTHAFVPTTCDTCHEDGLSFYLGNSTNPLQTRPNSGSYDHVHNPAIPAMTTGDCSQCHVTSTWVATALPSGHMPNPAGQPCTTCHTAAPSNYKLFASTAVMHTGIAGGCAQCHGGATQLSFYNNDMTIKAAASLSPAHIPAFSGEDCSACHAPNFVTNGFGPMNMTQATHAGVGSTCNSCHEAGLSFFMGAASPGLQGRPADHNSGNLAAPNDCSLCHTPANWNSTVLPSGHMPNPAGTNCTVCHTTAPTDYTTATLAANSVLHTGISGGCDTCHGSPSGALTWYNNYTPKDAVLSPAHIPYTAATDCSSCHSSATYPAGTFGPMNMTQATHNFVATTCNTCHEAGLSFTMGAASPGLQGRPADHSLGQMGAPTDCSQCHTTANWNSSTLPTGHLPNPASQPCATCHASAPSDYTPSTLASNTTLHTGITSNCGLCHGSPSGALTFYNNYTPKAAVLAPSHIPYLAGTDCAPCHSAQAAVTRTFGPMNMTQTTHTYVPTTCNTCHEANLSFYMGSASPALQGRPADHTTGQMVAPNDCSLCHTTANWNSNTMPAGHMPNPANSACTVCHSTAPADYTTATLAANSVLHTGITSNCGQCHGSASTPLTWYNNFTPKDAVLSPSHIPYTSGTDCSSCHSSATYAAGTFGPMNMTQAKHSFVPGTCDTCHEAGLSFYMGAASPALQGRPADHTTGQMVAPNDCSICHTTANWNSTTLPSGHMPNPANSACTVCHTTAPADYSTATLAANATLHTGITSGCITCHGAPNATAPVFYLNYTPKDAILSPVHIPTAATPCEDCHSTTVFTAFSGTTMTSAKHTSMFGYIGSTCDACHNKVTPALSFYGVTNLQTRPNDHNNGSKATEDCSSCHSPKQWDNAQTRKAAKAPATTARRAAITTIARPMLVNSTAATAALAVTATATPATAATATAGSAGISHAGVTSNCASCHDGVLAQGKGAGHIASNSICANCHTVTAWLPARFDHQGVTASCTSCHNGATAPGKPARHLDSSQDCSACHGTLAWLPARFNHSGLSATCMSCHNGITATGKQATHPVTTQDCSSCHDTQSWNGATSPARPLKPLIHAPRTPARSAPTTAAGSAPGNPAGSATRGTLQ